MCRYIETTHTYSQCKLQDEHLDGTLNPLAGFFSRITNNFNSAPAPGENAFTIENQQEIHVVREKQIIQCVTATGDPNQQDRPSNERRCTNLTPLNSTEASATVGETEHRGVCTVCQAAEDAIKAALARDVIIPIEVRPAPRSRGSQADGHVENIHHGPPRRRRRRQRRYKKNSCSCM